MPTVNIPNVGVVAFPDEMSQEDIATAIEKDIIAPKGEPTEAPKKDPESSGLLGGLAAVGEAMRHNQLPKSNEPAVTVPRFGEPGTITRGVSEVVSGLVEGATTPENIVALGTALAVPATAPAIGLAMLAAGTKATAQLAGEAAVTKNPQTIAEAATMGTVTALGGLLHGYNEIKDFRTSKTTVEPNPVKVDLQPPAPELVPKTAEALKEAIEGQTAAAQSREPSAASVEKPATIASDETAEPYNIAQPPQVVTPEKSAVGHPVPEPPPTTDPGLKFQESIADVPVKSKLVADIGESVQENQKLGITTVPIIQGSGLSKVFHAVGQAVSEIRDIPKFTEFRDALNGWNGELQKTSLEVRARMKDIESRVPLESRREAITNWLQAGGDSTYLDFWSNNTKGLKRKMAYMDAKSLTPDELKIAQSIRTLYDDLLTKAQAYGIVEDGLRDYVTQVWKRPLLKSSQLSRFSSKLAASFKFAKHRAFENFFEGEQLGQKPVTKDISQLLGLYMSEMGKTIATRDLVKDLTTKTAADGRPLAYPIGNAKVVGDAASGEAMLIRPGSKAHDISDYSKDFRHPALTKWKWIGKDEETGRNVMLQGDLALHPDIAKHVENVLSRSAIKRWYDSPTTLLGAIPKAIARGLDSGNALTKEIMFGFFAPFHHVQEGWHAVAHRINPLWDIPKMDPSNPRLTWAMDHGLQVAGDRASMEIFREGLGTGKIIEKVPVVGRWSREWSDFLFHTYIPGLKFKTFEAILERNKEVYANELKSGTATVDDVSYLSALQTNRAYGHMNYVDMGRDPTIKHLMQALLLAPDFLEARVGFVGQAAQGLVGKAGREQLKAIAFLSGVSWVGARIANQLTDGDPHFEEPFAVIHNNRTYTLRSVPEDMWRLFKDSRKFVYGRISPIVGRGTIELLTGKNYRGEKVTKWDTILDLLTAWIPITLRNMPGVRGLSPSQANNTVTAFENFLSSVGLQVSRHSSMKQAYELADAYMKKEGIKEDRGSYPVSKYQQLRYALEDQDLSKASQEITKLQTEENMTSKKIGYGFKESLYGPFTKSMEMDKRFKRAASPSDYLLIKEAEKQRDSIWKRFLKVHPSSG